jgi:hypothetical protein
MRFARVTWSAGSSPLTTLITNDSATTNAIVAQRGFECHPERDVGHHADEEPERRPERARVPSPTRSHTESPLSANNWPTTRERPAPIAVRTANSDDRDHVRANTSEAMFEATTSSASTRTATSPDITVLMMSSSPVNGSARTEIAVPGRRGRSGRE